MAKYLKFSEILDTFEHSTTLNHDCYLKDKNGIPTCIVWLFKVRFDRTMSEYL